MPAARSIRFLILLATLLLTASSAMAQPATAPVEAAAVVERVTGPDYSTLFRPVFSTQALLWFGGLLWLLLAIDYRRFGSFRTLDVFVIVALPVLFLLRSDGRVVTLFEHRVTYGLVAWIALCGAAGYFLVRTLSRLLRSEPRELPPVVVGAGAWILLGFAVSSTFCALAEMDLSPGAVAAMGGGRHLAAEGVLPYGQEGLSVGGGPLLYVLHVFLASSPSDLAPANWIGGTAHALVLLALVVLGWQMHSAALGALLAGLYALFPPVLEQITTPDQTVPAALVLWALIAASPSAGLAGAATSGALLAAASAAMFYPLLLVPAWLAYYLRRPRPANAGRNIDWLLFVAAFAIVGGVIGGYAVVKTPPQPTRIGPSAVAAQDATARSYTLTITPVGWLVAPDASISTTRPGSAPIGSRLALWLATDGDPTGTGPLFTPAQIEQIPEAEWRAARVTTRPVGLSTQTTGVPLRDVRPADPEAARALRLAYQHATADYPRWRRVVASLRTILENSWMTDPPQATFPAEVAPAAGVWGSLEQQSIRSLDAQESTQAARSVVAELVENVRCFRWYLLLGHAGLAVVLFFVLLLAASRCSVWHLASVTAALAAATQLWKPNEGGTDFAWYLPLVMVSLLAGRLPPVPPKPPLPLRRLYDPNAAAAGEGARPPA